jgi:hypothetical protein
MSTLIRVAAGFVLFTAAMPAGINCKAVWLQPNPIVLRPAESVSYTVNELDGLNWQGQVTGNPGLKITSSDENIVAVDKRSARLIGKSVGRVEIRVSFGECTSINVATVFSK